MGEARFYYKSSNAPAPNQPTSIGVVAIIEDHGKILLERRSDSNRWAIIGGAIKKEHEPIINHYIRGSKVVME